MRTINNTTATMIKTNAQLLANALNQGNAPRAIALAHDEGMFTFNTKGYGLIYETVSIDTASKQVVGWDGVEADLFDLDLGFFYELVEGSVEAGRLKVYAQTFMDIAYEVGWDVVGETKTRLFAVEDEKGYTLYVTKNGGIFFD